MRNMKCPLCQAPLERVNGSAVDPTDGITLYCPNKQCPAQEVIGHGKTDDAAFFIIQEKYANNWTRPHED